MLVRVTRLFDVGRLYSFMVHAAAFRRHCAGSFTELLIVSAHFFVDNHADAPHIHDCCGWIIPCAQDRKIQGGGESERWERALRYRVDGELSFVYLPKKRYMS